MSPNKSQPPSPHPTFQHLLKISMFSSSKCVVLLLTFGPEGRRPAFTRGGLASTAFLWVTPASLVFPSRPSKSCKTPISVCVQSLLPTKPSHWPMNAPPVEVQTLILWGVLVFSRWTDAARGPGGGFERLAWSSSASSSVKNSEAPQILWSLIIWTLAKMCIPSTNQELRFVDDDVTAKSHL